MINRCLKCEKRISFAWLLFSRYSTKYRCSNCKTAYAWNARRHIVGGVVGGLSGMLPFIFFLIFNSFSMGILLTIGVDIMILFMVPGQYGVLEN